MATKTLTILVAGHDAPSARQVADGFAGAGDVRVVVVEGLEDLVSRVAALAPGAVVATLGTPDHSTLEPLFRLARSGGCAVVLFAERAEAGVSALAVEAGVAAFVVDGLRPDRVRPIVETALSRYAAFETLKRERDEARTQLAERKLIERAKGILMQQKSLTEEQAYAALRKAAMKQGRRIADIAQSVITAAEVGI